MRPTTTPPVSTSKSSSLHWPEEREMDARFRISTGELPSSPSFFAPIFFGFPLHGWRCRQKFAA
jgi:hypothetical protein